MRCHPAAGAEASHERVKLAALSAQLGDLQQLEAKDLCRRWRALVGGSIPADLGRPLTLRILAYKLQAQHLGDLDPSSVRELARIVAHSKREADGEQSLAQLLLRADAIAEQSPPVKGRAENQSKNVAMAQIARPGTLLMREHNGVLHRVMVLDNGVTWNGKTYDSLSKIAFAITGTRWNGPRFFGLRGAPAKADGQNGSQNNRSRTIIGRGRSLKGRRSSRPEVPA